jgi:hypothetical protein
MVKPVDPAAFWESAGFYEENNGLKGRQVTETATEIEISELLKQFPTAANAVDPSLGSKAPTSSLYD